MAESNHGIDAEIKDGENYVRALKLVDLASKRPELGGVELNKDIVAFVGPTTVGKSSLINAVSGNPLTCRRHKYTNKTYIWKDPERSGPEIGGRSGKSKTENAQFCGKLPGTTIWICDLPGFFDNNGVDQQMKNGFSYKTVLCLQNTVRFVLVVTSAILEEHDPLPFYKLLYELHKISPKIADSLCIVSSKGGDSRVDLLLKGALEKSKDFLRGDKTIADIADVGRRIIDTVIENGDYFDFKAHQMKDGVDEEPYTLPNKQLFIDRVNRTKGMMLSDSKFPLLIGPEGQQEITEVHSHLYKILKRKIDNMRSALEKCIQRNIDYILGAQDKSGNKANAQSKLALFTEGKCNIDYVIKNSKSFDQFFDHAYKIGVIINDGYTKIIRMFTSVEKLRNMFKNDATILGEEELFSHIHMGLIRGAELYNAVIESSTVASEEEKIKAFEEQIRLRNDLNNAKKKCDEFAKYNKSYIVRGAQWLSDQIDDLVRYGILSNFWEINTMYYSILPRR